MKISQFKKIRKTRRVKTKNQAQNNFQKCKDNVSEAKSHTRSKRKSWALGFITVVSLFGITFLTPVLPAVAKDLSKRGSKPITDKTIVPSKKPIISKAISTTISSGSYLAGAICGAVFIITYKRWIKK